MEIGTKKIIKNFFVGLSGTLFIAILWSLFERQGAFYWETALLIMWVVYLAYAKKWAGVVGALVGPIVVALIMMSFGALFFSFGGTM